MFSTTIDTIIIISAVVGGGLGSTLIGLLSKLIKNKNTSLKAERVADDIHEKNVDEAIKQIYVLFESMNEILSDLKPSFDEESKEKINKFEQDFIAMSALINKIEKFDHEELINATLQQKAEKRNILHLKNKIAGFKKSKN